MRQKGAHEIDESKCESGKAFRLRPRTLGNIERKVGDSPRPFALARGISSSESEDMVKGKGVRRSEEETSFSRMR